MLPNPRRENIDYLVIGHLSRDISKHGEMLGGSTAYAARTAMAFGLRAGILTSWGEDINISELEGIAIVNSSFGDTTTFENNSSPGKLQQKVHQLAAPIEIQHLPPAWADPKIVHFAPLLGEISPRIIRNFPNSSIGITPQGWLRKLQNNGSVVSGEWPESDFVLQQAMAAVISQEDIGFDEKLLEKFILSSPILALTEAEKGARVFQQGEEIALAPAPILATDSTGAGDIFAACFFIRLHFGDNIAEAGRVANQLAAQSVERLGLPSTPSEDEIYDLMPRAIRG